MAANQIYTPISIQQLCSIMYRNEICFGKNMASKIVGGRTRLENLVAEGKIRAEKKNNLAQNGRWSCNAGDVIYYAKQKYKRTRKNKVI